MPWGSKQKMAYPPGGSQIHLEHVWDFNILKKRAIGISY
jgi:hypothetical protein